ncbi:MAG: DNA-directed RNA polymerase subunit omega [Bacteroidales bacterium]|jgi:DNA-directed RNA polymerase subunit K/omega|nr:DNA-directed RNA polymerase subunit omega [Bacteroidales bacterium]MBO5849179.1 DNA-directed RNA polymerase subunit omega [Bacteroidales bacterium]MBO5853733.1 DNA-directed RNA polymerase subunit omega [Bacteroidales bacterium]
MDFKKINTETTCVTRQKDQFYIGTGNIYETVAIMAKRSDQIAAEMKSELNKKIEEYTTSNDSLEEVFENKEQIEVAKYYEKLPKPTLIAVNEFLNDRIYYRNPNKENEGDF